MKKIFKLINEELKKNKKIFIFTSILLLIGFIVGTFFITILSNEDKKIINETITNFFMQIKSNKIDTIYILRTSFTTNLIYILFIFLLGISLVGLPVVIFLIFIKSFILGFSISSIIYKYKLSGTLLSLAYIFPQHIINLIIVSFLGVYSIKVSLTLFKLIVSKKQLNFKLTIKKYFGVLIISFILSVISSILESFISPYILKMLSFLIK